MAGNNIQPLLFINGISCLELMLMVIKCMNFTQNQQ